MILRPLEYREYCTVHAVSHSPFVANAFSRPIRLIPTSLLGIFAFQPLLKLISRHVDGVIEVSVVCQNAFPKLYRVIYLMTSSLLLTMLQGSVLKQSICRRV